MPSDTVIGMPPIEATEKNPVRVCSDPSVELRNRMAVWVETDNTRDWGAGSLESGMAPARRSKSSKLSSLNPYPR